ncbi:MAG TPA: hypothetical protein PLD47_17345 [Aggregatilineales bacterium]|nr:hypothetical protein [Aggregatilineales bacterium]
MVDSAPFQDILADGLVGGDQGKRTTPVLLVRKLVAVRPVRVLQ